MRRPDVLKAQEAALVILDYLADLKSIPITYKHECYIRLGNFKIECKNEEWIGSAALDYLINSKNLKDVDIKAFIVEQEEFAHKNIQTQAYQSGMLAVLSLLKERFEIV